MRLHNVTVCTIVFFWQVFWLSFCPYDFLFLLSCLHFCVFLFFTDTNRKTIFLLWPSLLAPPRFLTWLFQGLGIGLGSGSGSAGRWPFWLVTDIEWLPLFQDSGWMVPPSAAAEGSYTRLHRKTGGIFKIKAWGKTQWGFICFLLLIFCVMLKYIFSTNKNNKA